MPKLKTNKSVAKRIKVTKSGKLKRHHPGRRHLMSVKKSSRRRKLRKSVTVEARFAKIFAAVLQG